jgi:hypothetical protein
MCSFWDVASIKIYEETASPPRSCNAPSSRSSPGSSVSSSYSPSSSTSASTSSSGLESPRVGPTSSSSISSPRVSQYYNSSSIEVSSSSVPVSPLQTSQTSSKAFSITKPYYPPPTATKTPGFSPIKAVVSTVVTKTLINNLKTSTVTTTENRCAICQYTESEGARPTKINSPTFTSTKASTPAGALNIGYDVCIDSTVTVTATVTGVRPSTVPSNVQQAPVYSSSIPAKVVAVPSSTPVKPVVVASAPYSVAENGTAAGGIPKSTAMYPYTTSGPLQVSTNSAGKNAAAMLAVVGSTIAAIFFL